MTRQAVTTHAAPTGSHRRRAGGRLALVASAFALVVTALGVNASASVAPRGSATSSASSPRLAPTALYPIGVADPSEPSGFAPPLPTSMSGYRETYVNDFSGTSLPAGWYTFSGEPGGDPGGLLASSHVQVANGELQLLTTYVPSVGKWVTGGLCQCGLGHVFGAYFVRSRITGPGPNEAELLWPKNNTWPPEIDFNETGSFSMRTTSTLHYGVNNKMTHGNININMTRWHTWGVVWTRSLIVYTVDGRVWGRIGTTAHIPRIPMTLDLEQRTSCQPVKYCPHAPATMQVDWVAEFNRP